MSPSSADIIVILAGPAGVVAALHTGQLGANCAQ